MAPKVHHPLRPPTAIVTSDTQMQVQGCWTVRQGGWSSTHSALSLAAPPPPGPAQWNLPQGTADKWSCHVKPQGCRNQWAADEASDFARKYSVYHSRSCPWLETDVLSPAAHSCSGLAAGPPGPHPPGAPALREASVFEKSRASEFSYIMLLIPVGLLKKNITN